MAEPPDSGVLERGDSLDSVISEMEVDALLDHDDLSGNRSSQASLGGIAVPVPRILKILDTLWNGPAKPVEPHITVIFRPLQEFRDRVVGLISQQTAKALLGTCIILWALLFQFVAKRSILAVPFIDGERAESLRCSGSNDLWLGKNDQCGLNAELCLQPQGSTFKFKCLSNCVKESWSYNNQIVGDYESIYRSFVVGGNNTYRADSYICAAALHHGIISDRFGGCGIVRFGKATSRFISEKGHNRIESIGFDSEFPQSFAFDDLANVQMSGCWDFRTIIITINVIFSFIFGYFVASPSWFFFTQCLCGFWTVILASNPPLNGGTESENAEVISLGFRRLLPLMFVCYVVFVSSTRLLLKDVKAHLSRALLWGAGYWVGDLENYVFAYLPIDRLTIEDLNKQAGAWLALFIIMGLLVTIALGQTYVIWRVGKFGPYVSYYFAVGVGMLLLYFIPNETLRLHHYIFALILLPGTGFQTSPSLFYNGILVGLLVAGVARWDFDSIIQTREQLRRGAPSLEGSIPSFLDPVFGPEGIVIRWNSSLESTWDGFSLLINDIERYRGSLSEFEFTAWLDNVHRNVSLATLPVKYYFRLAYAMVRSTETSDYTRTAVLDQKALNWTLPLDGRS